MLEMNSLWFEIAIVSLIFAVGNIFFGHFEEHTPKLKRLLKYLLVLILVVGTSALAGRVLALIILGLLFIPAIYLHAIYLPKKGINGLTGEPKEKYYKLRGWDKKDRK